MLDQESGDTAPDFDFDSAVSDIGNDIFDREETPEDAPVVEAAEAPVTPEVTAEAPVTPEAVETVPAPASWAKDKHEHWAKMPKEAQDYYLVREKQMLDGLEQYKGDAGLGKQMKDVFNPYKPFLNAQGIDEVKASQYLMNAHYKLSTGSLQDKQALFADLARQYGINLPGAEEQAPVDPHVKALRDELAAIKSTVSQSQQAALNETRSKVERDVATFASDPKNLYFDEVADDIVILLNGGATLQDAYEKAVWANPVTRAKELARVQTETETKFKEKASKEAAVAKKASSTNVRSRDTGKAPTGPIGSMEDTMRAQLAIINSRT